MTGLGRRLAAGWRAVERFHDELFVVPWRRSVAREVRRQEDTLRTLVLLESLGVDNPVAYDTLDLVPYLVADLHDWHRRMGRAEFGDASVCC
ncbi:cory-CC-star protein [Pseudonocardia nigra]|uniref:cory-CC-star protein n=1 Tax=Pseudonocardia nigra TaxID=1921578 RepID=UPI001C5E87AA|nr:cory-CC-star protein [Pseudonocardia nigra]